MHHLRYGNSSEGYKLSAMAGFRCDMSPRSPGPASRRRLETYKSYENESDGLDE